MHIGETRNNGKYGFLVSNRQIRLYAGVNKNNLILDTTGTTMNGNNTFSVDSSGNTKVAALKVTTGVVGDGGGLKHNRVSTGSIAANSSALVTVTWGTPFADANYTVTTSVQDATTSSSALSVVHIESITASAVTVRVNNTSAGALGGILHIMAMHDSSVAIP